MNTLEKYVMAVRDGMEAGTPISTIEEIVDEVRGVGRLVVAMLDAFTTEEISNATVASGRLRTIVITAALAEVLLLLIAFLRTRRETKKLTESIHHSIYSLEGTVRRIAEGNFGDRVQGMNVEELRELGEQVNQMANRLETLIAEIRRNQDHLARAELRTLQAQINPHFLYNTLDSIIWMGESGKNREVVRMTSALSKLLRKSISNEKEIVTVKEEVEYVSEYLKIQQLRYHDKLSYEIDVDESVLSNSIAKLVLQPLVENAIYHGIKVKEGMGHIRISGERAGGDIRLVVRDDGPGMDEEALSHILDGSREGGISKVGVKNVNDRLKLHYGDEYGLSFESGRGKGMKVTITIPRDAGPEEAAL
jgi:two-component system sensor histidine kinase YesM